MPITISTRDNVRRNRKISSDRYERYEERQAIHVQKQHED